MLGLSVIAPKRAQKHRNEKRSKPAGSLLAYDELCMQGTGSLDAFQDVNHVAR